MNIFSCNIIHTVQYDQALGIGVSGRMQKETERPRYTVETKMQEWKCRICLQYCDEVLFIVGVTKKDIELKNSFRPN